jgi:hypothetical protein
MIKSKAVFPDEGPSEFGSNPNETGRIEEPNNCETCNWIEAMNNNLPTIYEGTSSEAN